MSFDILHALGLAAALFVAYSLGNARRLYREEKGWAGRTGRGRLDAWDEADPPGDSSEVVESPGSGKVGSPPPLPPPPSTWSAWNAGYESGYRAAMARQPGVRERLAAGAEGGREVERGKVLG